MLVVVVVLAGSPGASPPAAATPSMRGWAMLAASPSLWKTALAGGRMLNVIPQNLIPVPALQTWLHSRTLPRWQGGEFRQWMKSRDRRDQKSAIRGQKNPEG